MSRRLFIAALLARPLPAAAHDDWNKALEGPMSPGSVAVLVEHAEAPEAQARWREALKDSGSPVRAAVGRAIYAAGATALAPDVVGALAKETDAVAAEELMRALAGNLLGRTRGFDAVRHHAALAEFDDSSASTSEPSAGALAAFFDRAAEPSVQEQWRSALRDDQPSVRAAAARLVHVGGAQALLPALQEALAAETDAAVAAEQIRMLAASEAEIPSGELLAAMRRMPRLVRIASRVLGRQGGVDALAVLGAVRAMDPSGDGRRALISAATNGGLEGMGRAASIALREQDDVAWAAVLSSWRPSKPIDTALLVASLQASDPRVRAATYWHIAAGLIPLEGPLLEAIESAPEAGPSGTAEGAAAVDAQFGFELLRRARGLTSKENAAWLQKIEHEPSPPRLPGAVPPIAHHLTAKERQLLFKKEVLRIGKDLPVAPADAPLDDPPAIRSNLGFYPVGFATSVVKATGCEPKPTERVLVELIGGRRPRQANVLWKEATPECAEAARLLAVTSFSAMPPPTHGRDLRLLVMSPTLVSWLETPGELAFAERGSPVPAPRKVHDVKPPKQTRPQRKAGPAVVEALIAPAGEVWALHFLGGDPSYAVAALPVAAQWTFAPTEVGGQPLPVLTTLEVTSR